jgi:hypothetical protein
VAGEGQGGAACLGGEGGADGVRLVRQEWQ